MRRDCLDAPGWHLPLLVSLVLLVAGTGLLLPPRTAPIALHSRILSGYVPMLLVAWGLTGYVAFASRTESVVRRLVGNRDRDRLAADVALGLGLMLALVAAESMLGPHLDATRAAAVAAILPRSWSEHAVWLVVAASVGFSEELVYRGYLQSRFQEISGAPVVGVAVQAVLFGVAHAEQGGAAALRIAGYGAVLGAVTAWRKSLRPGILCHVAVDVLSGL